MARPQFGLNIAQPPGVTASGASQVIMYGDVASAGAQGLVVSLSAAVAIVLDNHGSHTFYVEFGSGQSSFAFILDPHAVLPINTDVPLTQATIIDLSLPGQNVVPGGLRLPSVSTFPDEFVADIGGGLIMLTASDNPMEVGRDYRPLSTVLYNPSSGSFEPQRTPTAWIPGATTANPNVTVWTPQAGNRFRLMGLTLKLSATGTMYLNDGAHTFFVADYISGSGALVVNFPFNGYLSAAAGNALTLAYQGTPPVQLTYNVWGTEEAA